MSFYSGMRSQGFSSSAPSTANTALPPALASMFGRAPAAPASMAPASAAPMALPAAQQSGAGAPMAINMQALQTQPTGTVASNPNYPVLDFRMQPTYADGGMVPPAGMAPPSPQPMPQMPSAPATPISSADMEGEIQRLMSQNPEVIQKIQQTLMQAVQSGQLTLEQLNTAVQLAKAAAQNPELYPRLRALAIQRGLADEDELPQQYDQSIVMALLLAGAAVQQQMGGQSSGPVPQMANGGRVRPGMYAAGGGIATGSPSGDRTGRADDIPIRVSGGEFVIPKHVVDAKGTEFFQKMLDQYNMSSKTA